ncbi:MAG: adventurous gliding motility protein GltJ [Myxococcaceae bacterium]
MRFVCDSCRAQYMISDEKVGAKGVKVRCKKCGYVILVRKAEAAPPPPPADFNDSTQIMSNPLANQGGASFDSEQTQLGTPVRDSSTTQALGGGDSGGGSKGVLASVEDDEIGAVFDQVLRTGPNPIPQQDSSSDTALGDEDDDRLSTRVLDQETVKKLAEESGMAVFGASPSGEKNGKKCEKVAQDWFVAIDEKQTGPLTVEKLKDLWDRGEIGPDSLCWRAGFSDWMPLSEVAELASELAPKPAKPVLAGPAPSAAVVTVPVESAFTAGGVTKTVRSEMSMLASAPVEETGGWKPSAASALASLVKEEIDAMAKPSAPAPSLSPSRGSGLLDLPDTGSTSIPNGKPGTDVAMRNSAGGLQQPPSSMVDPYNNAPSPYAAPYGQYAPPSPPQGLSKGLTIGLIVAGVAVLALVGVVLFLVIGRSASNSEGRQQAAVTPPGALAVKTPAAAAPAAEPVKKLDMPPPPTASNAQPLPPNPKAEPPAAASLPPSATSRADLREARAERAAERAIEKAERPRETRVAKADRGSRGDDEGESFGGKEPEEKTSKKKPVAEPSGDDDEFNSMFGGGGGSKKKDTSSSDEPKSPKKGGYIPPAPGSGAGEVESLSSSDIMTVVVQNKPAIMKCVAEQKNKDPDMTGTLVMRWQVQPSGRTSNVSVQSDEFKSTYMASCIGGLIKSWSFPRHKVAGDPINFPFKF